MISYVDGDIFEYVATGEYGMFIHGCNCLHTMGAGVAKTAKAFCPALLKADKEQTIYGDRDKLGTMSKVVEVYNGNIVVMANGYTQFDYKYSLAGVAPVDLDAIEKLFTTVGERCTHLKVIIPKIGAGLAGGDWDEIESIINKVAKDVDITVVNYVP